MQIDILDTGSPSVMVWNDFDGRPATALELGMLIGSKRLVINFRIKEIQVEEQGVVAIDLVDCGIFSLRGIDVHKSED